MESASSDEFPAGVERKGIGTPATRAAIIEKLVQKGFIERRGDAEGNIRPRLIRWIDGRVYEIDRLKHKCRAASTKVVGCGIRYTVMIGGHESFLYNEDEKWFVEAKEPCL